MGDKLVVYNTPLTPIARPTPDCSLRGAPAGHVPPIGISRGEAGAVPLLILGARAQARFVAGVCRVELALAQWIEALIALAILMAGRAPLEKAAVVSRAVRTATGLRARRTGEFLARQAAVAVVVERVKPRRRAVPFRPRDAVVAVRVQVREPVVAVVVFAVLGQEFSAGDPAVSVVVRQTEARSIEVPRLQS
jgi:hypothetical protein